MFSSAFSSSLMWSLKAQRLGGLAHRARGSRSCAMMAFEGKPGKIDPGSELDSMLYNHKACKHPWGPWRLHFAKEEIPS